jgi:hypothetical protein
MRVHSRTSYSKATPSGSFFANQASAASLLAKTLREMPRSLTGNEYRYFRNAHAQNRPKSRQLRTARRRKNEDGGRHVGIIEWLLVWLIVNALYVVWRILVTTEVETRDRSIRKMPNVADL